MIIKIYLLLSIWLTFNAFSFISSQISSSTDLSAISSTLGSLLRGSESLTNTTYPNEFQSRVTLISGNISSVWRIELLTPNPLTYADCHYVIVSSNDSAIDTQLSQQNENVAVLSTIHDPLSIGLANISWPARNASLQFNYQMSSITTNHYVLNYVIFDPSQFQTLFYFFTITDPTVDNTPLDTNWLNFTGLDPSPLRLSPFINNSAEYSDNNVQFTETHLNYSIIIIPSLNWQYTPNILNMYSILFLVNPPSTISNCYISYYLTNINSMDFNSDTIATTFQYTVEMRPMTTEIFITELVMPSDSELYFNFTFFDIYLQDYNTSHNFVFNVPKSFHTFNNGNTQQWNNLIQLKAKSTTSSISDSIINSFITSVPPSTTKLDLAPFLVKHKILTTERTSINVDEYNSSTSTSSINNDLLPATGGTIIGNSLTQSLINSLGQVVISQSPILSSVSSMINSAATVANGIGLTGPDLASSTGFESPIPNNNNNQLIGNSEILPKETDIISLLDFTYSIESNLDINTINIEFTANTASIGYTGLSSVGMQYQFIDSNLNYIILSPLNSQSLTINSESFGSSNLNTGDLIMNLPQYSTDADIQPSIINYPAQSSTFSPIQTEITNTFVYSNLPVNANNDLLLFQFFYTINSTGFKLYYSPWLNWNVTSSSSVLENTALILYNSNFNCKTVDFTRKIEFTPTSSSKTTVQLDIQVFSTDIMDSSSSSISLDSNIVTITNPAKSFQTGQTILGPSIQSVNLVSPTEVIFHFASPNWIQNDLLMTSIGNTTFSVQFSISLSIHSLPISYSFTFIQPSNSNDIPSIECDTNSYTLFYPNDLSISNLYYYPIPTTDLSSSNFFGAVIPPKFTSPNITQSQVQNLFGNIFGANKLVNSLHKTRKQLTGAASSLSSLAGLFSNSALAGLLPSFTQTASLTSDQFQTLIGGSASSLSSGSPASPISFSEGYCFIPCLAGSQTLTNLGECVGGCGSNLLGSNTDSSQSTQINNALTQLSNSFQDQVLQQANQTNSSSSSNNNINNNSPNYNCLKCTNDVSQWPETTIVLTARQCGAYCVNNAVYNDQWAHTDPYTGISNIPTNSSSTASTVPLSTSTSTNITSAQLNSSNFANSTTITNISIPNLTTAFFVIKNLNGIRSNHEFNKLLEDNEQVLTMKVHFIKQFTSFYHLYTSSITNSTSSITKVDSNNGENSCSVKSLNNCLELCIVPLDTLNSFQIQYQVEYQCAKSCIDQVCELIDSNNNSIPLFTLMQSFQLMSILNAIQNKESKVTITHTNKLGALPALTSPESSILGALSTLFLGNDYSQLLNISTLLPTNNNQNSSSSSSTSINSTNPVLDTTAFTTCSKCMINCPYSTFDIWSTCIATICGLTCLTTSAQSLTKASLPSLPSSMPALSNSLTTIATTKLFTDTAQNTFSQTFKLDLSTIYQTLNFSSRSEFKLNLSNFYIPHQPINSKLITNSQCKKLNQTLVSTEGCSLNCRNLIEMSQRSQKDSLIQYAMCLNNCLSLDCKLNDVSYLISLRNMRLLGNTIQNLHHSNSSDNNGTSLVISVNPSNLTKFYTYPLYFLPSSSFTNITKVSNLSFSSSSFEFYFPNSVCVKCSEYCANKSIVKVRSCLSTICRYGCMIPPGKDQKI